MQGLGRERGSASWGRGRTLGTSGLPITFSTAIAQNTNLSSIHSGDFKPGTRKGQNGAATDLVVQPALGQPGNELGRVVDVVDQAVDQRQEAAVGAHLQGRSEDQPGLVQLHVDLEQWRNALLQGRRGGQRLAPGVSASPRGSVPRPGAGPPASRWPGPLWGAHLPGGPCSTCRHGPGLGRLEVDTTGRLQGAKPVSATYWPCGLEQDTDLPVSPNA